MAVDHLRDGNRQSIVVKPNIDEELIDYLYVVENIRQGEIAESTLLENVVQSPEPSTDGFPELLEMFSKEGYQSWNSVFGFKSYEKEGKLWVYALYSDDNGESHVKLTAPYQAVFRSIENNLERFDSRFRRMGLCLLVSGFLFQGLSIFV